MTRVLVTGGAGFIGSALIRYILEKHSCVLMNIDKLTYAANLDALHQVKNNEKYFFKKIDICSKEQVHIIFREFKPDFIFHLAAESHVDRSIDSPDEFIQTNIIGTYNLLEAFRRYHHSLENDQKKAIRFIHVSTDEVYGDLPHPDQYPDRAGQLFTEESNYLPSSPYSASKASSDHLVQAWCRTFNLPLIVTNCSNNYGPYQNKEKLIPKSILSALSGNKIHIYGSGTQIRDWLHVEDHVMALWKVALFGKVGDKYNIGGNNELTNLQVVKAICKLLDEFIPIEANEIAGSVSPNIHSYDELIEHINDRPGHDLRYAIDASKISNEIGWKPNETFSSGLRKTVRWYIDNRIF